MSLFSRLIPQGLTKRRPPEGAPEPALFRDIQVVPGREVYLDRSLTDGGPVWPDFATQTWVRFCRHGRPCDRAPAAALGPDAQLDRPAVWMGSMNMHFGHLVAEGLTRLPWSLAQRPRDLYLFVCDPALTDAEIPAFFWDLLAWYGVPRQQVLRVTRPLRVAELRVLPQAEQMNFTAPADLYLDLVEQTARQNRLRVRRSDLLYVGREGLLPQGLGRHAGEDFLIALLDRLGVASLNPATAPLRDQLAAYAGARRIVFAEGSAMHGRQILGRLDQEIVVLVRRPKMRLVQQALQARASTVHYVEASRRIMAAVRADGAVLQQKALCFYDLAAVFEVFARLGINLADNWDATAFHDAVLRDIKAWLANLACDPARYDRTATEHRIAEALAAEAIACDWRPIWPDLATTPTVH